MLVLSVTLNRFLSNRLFEIRRSRHWLVKDTGRTDGSCRILSPSAPQRTWRLTVDAQERPAHTVLVPEPDIASDHFDRLGSFLYARKGHFHAQPLDCSGGSITSLFQEQPAASRKAPVQTLATRLAWGAKSLMSATVPASQSIAESGGPPATTSVSRRSPGNAFEVSTGTPEQLATLPP
jgi:hypothetical protein